MTDDTTVSTTASTPPTPSAEPSADTATAPKRLRRAGLPVRDDPQPERIGGDAGAREALEMARRVIDLVSDRKAADIVLLGVGELTTVADYLVICSGGSERQLSAIADGVAQGLKEIGVQAIGREGAATAHWVLMDFGAVIVHIFAQPERDYYQLEKLWADAPMLVRIQ